MYSASVHFQISFTFRGNKPEKKDYKQKIFPHPISAHFIGKYIVPFSECVSVVSVLALLLLSKAQSYRVNCFYLRYLFVVVVFEDYFNPTAIFLKYVNKYEVYDLKQRCNRMNTARRKKNSWKNGNNSDIMWMANERCREEESNNLRFECFSSICFVAVYRSTNYSSILFSLWYSWYSPWSIYQIVLYVLYPLHASAERFSLFCSLLFFFRDVCTRVYRYSYDDKYDLLYNLFIRTNEQLKPDYIRSNAVLWNPAKVSCYL